MQNCSYLSIDLGAIEANLKILQTKGVELMPMVKANAYGTHAIALTRFYEKRGIQIVGVSHVEEGICLRKAGIGLPVFVLSAPPFEAARVAKWDLEPAVSSIEEIEALEHAATAAKKKLHVHLHVNTGMNRFGTSAENFAPLLEMIKKATHLIYNGIMTHFAAADTPQFDDFSHKQIALFKEIVDAHTVLPRWIHMANSAGTLRFPLPFCNLARVGVALLGYGSDIRERGSFFPSLSLHSYIANIAACKKGDTIGYERAYKIEKESALVGIIPFGYHDGLHRCYSGSSHVLVKGERAPILGKICMDFLMIDLTEIPNVKVGDPVEVFNASLRPETVAEWGNTDVRQLLACLGPRVQRRILKS